MSVLYTNNATTTLSASITNSTTSLSVASGKGSLFPAITGSDFFFVTISNSAGTNEIVKVTARSVDTFTIVRAQDGTSAAAWSAGDKVELRITKAMLDQFKTDAIAAYTASDVLAKLLTVDGAGSGLDADTLDGNHASAFYLATNPSGYTTNTGTVTSVGGTGSYGGLTLSGTVTTSGNLTLGGTPTGTWPISVSGSSASCTGNAATATSSGYLTGGDSAFYAYLYNNNAGDLNNSYNSPGLYSSEYVGGTNNPAGTTGQNGHWIQISDAGGTDVKTQWYYHNGGSDISMRLMWGSGAWKPWRKLLHDGNYNSYAPTLTGSGATGTWGISISGNAATAGNADTLDGQHGSYYQPSSTAITTSNIGSQSVNYASSAGNADTLDGNHASAFSLTSHNHNGTYLTSVPAATSSALGGIKVSLSGTTLTITV